MYRHRKPLAHRVAELVGVQDEERRRSRHSHRPRVDLRYTIAEIRRPSSRVDAALGGPVDLDVFAARQLGQHHLALDEDVEAGGRLTFEVDLTSIDFGDMACLAE